MTSGCTRNWETLARGLTHPTGRKAAVSAAQNKARRTTPPENGLMSQLLSCKEVFIASPFSPSRSALSPFAALDPDRPPADCLVPRFASCHELRCPPRNGEGFASERYTHRIRHLRTYPD